MESSFVLSQLKTRWCFFGSMQHLKRFVDSFQRAHSLRNTNINSNQLTVQLKILSTWWTRVQRCTWTMSRLWHWLRNAMWLWHRLGHRLWHGLWHGLWYALWLWLWAWSALRLLWLLRSWLRQFRLLWYWLASRWTFHWLSSSGSLWSL